MRLRLSALLILFACLSPVSAHAAESFEGCKYVITSLPAVLTTQGVWCMKSDLATGITSGNAITVQANNVILDCNYFKLGGLSAGAATAAMGIRAEGQTNTTVRNCNIRGFFTGVVFRGSYGALIEDNVLDGNTGLGISVENGATGAVIRRNRVVDTGGSTHVSSYSGIQGDGDIHIQDNIVSGVYGDGAGNSDVTGIYLINADGTVTGNRISNLTPDGSGLIYGIRAEQSGRVVYGHNYIIGTGSPSSFGIVCVDDLGVVINNAIIGINTGISACTSIAGPVGPAGPQGPPGPQGPAGETLEFGNGTAWAAAGRARDCFLGEAILTAGAVGVGTPARGQLLSIANNQALFAVLGTMHGGDGRTTFALPDLEAAAPNNTTYTICTEGIFPSRE